MNAAAVLRVIVEAQTGPASANLAKFDAQLKATAAGADASMGRVASSTDKAAAAGKRMEATGRSISKVGKSLMLATAPLALFGAESVKMSLNFKRQMGLVATDAGGTAREVKKLEHSVLGLSRSSQFGPQKLAESLFHVESSGYRGAKAMAVLKASSKLATVGNSELEATTYALVSATKAIYGASDEGLGKIKQTSAELNGIVAHGDMRLEELTSAMSTGLIPKAKSMGISLRGVGAAMDVMTTRGMPAQRAAYALGFTMSKLIPAGEKAESAFESIHLSEESLVKAAQGPGGYVHTLEVLKAHLQSLPTEAQRTKKLNEMFGGGRMTAGLLIDIQNLGEMRKIYGELGKEVGKYAAHVKEAEEQPLVKLKTAWSSIQASMTEIGGELLPIIVPGLESVVHLADGAMHAFSGLPTGVQQTAVEVGLVAVGLSGALFVTGKLVESMGVLRASMAGVAAANALGSLTSGAGDLGAAFKLAAGGEMGGFAMLGSDAAHGLIGGLTKVLPMAAAAAGLGNILISATSGDWEGAGYKAGGALVGGIAGAFLGPEGAMVGAGIGSFIGGLLVPAKKLTPMQRQMAENSEHVARAFGNEKESASALKGAQGHVAHAQERVHATSKELARAEEHLQEVQHSHAGKSLGLFDAENKVFETFQKQREAIKGKQQAMEELHWAERNAGKGIAEVVHSSALAIANEQRHLRRIHNQETREGASPELVEHFNQGRQRLTRYEEKYAEAIHMAKERNVEWGRTLEGLTPIQHRFGEQGRALNRIISDQKQKIGELRQAVGAGGGPYAHMELDRAEHKLRKLESTSAQVSKAIVSHMSLSEKETLAAVMRMATGTATGAGAMGEAVTAGLGILSKNVNSALKGFGLSKGVSFDLSKVATGALALGANLLGFSIPGKQTGGFTVPGTSTGDRHFHVLPQGSFVMNREATAAHGLQNGGVPVMLESRERVFMPHEVAQYGAGNLAALNASVPRFQKGGSLGPEPVIAGPSGALQSVGQAAIHQVYKGAESYLAKHKPKAPSGGPGGVSGAAFKHGRFTFPLPAGSWGQPISVDQGVDIAAPGHTPLLAIANGVIKGHGISGFGPWAPILGLGGGTEVYYGHAGPGNEVPVGSHVRAGQVIGEVGAGIVGISTGPHLEIGFYPPGPMGAGAAMKSALGLQRGGPVGMTDGGAPNGNKFQNALGDIWHRVAPLYGRSRESEHPTTILGKLSGAYGIEGKSKFGKTVVLQPRLGRDVVNEHGEGMRTLLHEWTHVYQDQREHMQRWEAEGGASAFALWAGQQAFGPGPWAPTTRSYRKYEQNVLQQKGWEWVKRGQFNASLQPPGYASGGLVRKLATGGSVKGPWAGTSIDKTYPPGNGLGSGPTLPDYVIEALTEWAGLPGKTMRQITEGESSGEPGMDIPDPPGRGRGLLAINSVTSGDHHSSAYLRNPILNSLVAKSLAPSGPNANIWHGSSHVTGWNLHYSGDPTAIAKHLGGTGSGSGSTPVPKQITGTYGPAKGSTGKGGGTNAPPGHFKVVTGSLSFGSWPTTLHACRKELEERRQQLAEYKGALRKTKDPQTHHSLEANVKAIQSRIRGLLKLQSRLLLKQRHEKVTKGITARGVFPEIEGQIQRYERAYNQANEFAEQVVGLEPEEGSAAAAYIAQTETPAWQAVLSTEALWRNEILTGEQVAMTRLSGLQGQLESIDALKTTHPKAFRKQKYRIKPLKEAIAAVKAVYTPPQAKSLKALAEGNYTGDTGTFAEALENVQGMSSNHRMVAELPATPQAGSYGGLIWDTQMQIRELGLKVKQAQESAGGAGNSEREALLEELLRQANQEKIVRGIEQKTLGESDLIPHAGSYASGGIVSALVGEKGPELATFPTGTRITPAGETRQMLKPHVAVHIYEGEGRVEVEVDDQKVEAVVNRMNRRGARTAGRGLARAGS